MANVLIIDDDSYLADDLKLFIEDQGHSCSICNKADDVISNLGNLKQFDWIILDIMMLRGKFIKNSNPDKETGEILYENIREKYPQKKILVISAKNYDDMKTEFRKDNHVICILKPITQGKLNEILEVINRRR